MSKRFPRYYYLVATLVIFVTEVVIALYVNDAVIRPFLGDVLATILVYTFIMGVSNGKPLPVASLALFISFCVEIAQFFELVYRLNLDQYKFALVVLGTSFSLWDLVMYCLGFFLICVVEWYYAFAKAEQSSLPRQ
ncbi:hypothetical protein BST97_15140 [Nonlabens spongiae]|uniref:DUF2809 domain-containing protein n=1 Tax=Nonlabens spongiae TaxID=331648 RepID=A0A1W6MNM7_9FLAO|nr:DUF2809 domain-containing protein [Nonlabens spongiae]ARN79210.1 hypothetical protein BST97_15140 [Nonlabens spongiae]